MAFCDYEQINNKIKALKLAIERSETLMNFLKTIDFINEPHLYFKQSSLRSTIEINCTNDNIAGRPTLSFHLNADVKGKITLLL